MKKLSAKQGKTITLIAALAALLTAAGVLWANRPVPRRENGIELLDFPLGSKLQGYDVYDSQGRTLDISQISSTPVRGLPRGVPLLPRPAHPVQYKRVPSGFRLGRHRPPGRPGQAAYPPFRVLFCQRAA